MGRRGNGVRQSSGPLVGRSWCLPSSLALGSEQVVRLGSAAGVFTQVFTEPLNMASGVPRFSPSSGRSHEVAAQDFLQGGLFS